MAADQNARMDRRAAASIVAWLVWATCPSSQAADAVVFRCTGEDGAVSLQDRPCAPAQAEQRRVLRVPSGTPAASPAPAAVAPSAPAPAVTAEPARPRREPEPLYECRRPDDSVYESRDGIPQRHWVPLWVLGLDPRAPPRLFGEVGRRPSPPPRSGPGLSTPTPGAGLGAGTWVLEQCYRLPAAEACDRRRAQLDTLARRLLHAHQRERRELRQVRDALREQVQAECGR
jgi:hypothetical protein